MATDTRRLEDDLPDTSLFWRWAWRALRPWSGGSSSPSAPLLVLLGYFGVSRESMVAKQIPYIVSGGIGGIVFAVLGAYFLGTQELRRDSGRLDRLEVMVAELHEALLGRATSPATDNRGASDRLQRVLAIENAETFHRAGCPMLDARTRTTLSAAAVKRRKLRPCPLCEPALIDA